MTIPSPRHADRASQDGYLTTLRAIRSWGVEDLDVFDPTRFRLSLISRW